MRHLNSSERGFALVIALSLMAFIVLLLLSITTLVRVESQSAEITQDRLKARLNAQLGAMVALGQLQKYAGPDQRVTARADITLNTGQTIGDMENPLLTGVWRSYSVDGSTELDTAVPFYLISGNEDIDLLWNSPSPAENHPVGTILPTTPTQDEWITLVEGDTALDGTTNSVELKAPSVDILGETNQPQGSFAYAVLDEGIKASVGIGKIDPADTSDNFEAEDSGLSPMRFGVEYVPPLASVSTDEESLGKLGNVGELVFVDSDLRSDELDPFAFDLTVRSRSLLTNTREGGLKKNLTSALSNYKGAFFDLTSSHPSGDRIFDQLVFPGNSADDSGGPLWSLLSDHYTDFKDLPEGQPVAASPLTDSEAGISPILTTFQYYFHASLQESLSDPPTTANVRFHHLPAVTLWNPYDRPIAADTYYLYVNFNRGFDGAWLAAAVSREQGLETPNSGLGRTKGVIRQDRNGKPYEIFWDTKHRGFNAFSDWSEKDSFDDNQKLYRQGAMLFTVDSPQIQPGESIVFSPGEVFGTGGAQPYSKDFSSIASLNDNELVPGAPESSNYFYADAPSPINVSDDPNLYLQLFTFNFKNPKANLGHFNNIDVILARRLDDTGVGSEEIFLRPLQHIKTGIYGTGHNVGFMKDREYQIRSGGDEMDLTDGKPIIQENNSVNPAMGIAIWQNMTDSFRYQAMSGNTNSSFAAPIRWIANANPRASIFDGTALERNSDAGSGYKASPQIKAFYTDQPDTLNDIQMAGGNRTFVVADLDVDRAVLFNTEGVGKWQSIGELMHVPLFPTQYDSFDAYETGDFGVTNSVLPAYLIGNSLASPWLSLDAVSRSAWPSSNDEFLGNENRVFYDFPYLLNEALWDRYFLTSHDPSDLDDDKVVEFPLANSRLVSSDGAPITNFELSEFDESGANLMIVGGFNINSTSETAWATLLASFFGINLSNTITTDEVDTGRKSPFLRLQNGRLLEVTQNSDGTSDFDALSPANYFGYRSLGESQIDALATEIVKEVRKRGPFRGLADFVNREPESSDTERQLAGALHSAIENAVIETPGGGEKRINDFLDSGLTPFNDLLNDFNTYLGNYTEAALQGRHADDSLGALTQMDLLARLGSVLVPRSDTFTIISEGRYQNPFNSDAFVSTRCEMVVQRIAEKIDPQTSEPIYSLPTSPFGRRFEIVSIRYLN